MDLKDFLRIYFYFMASLIGPLWEQIYGAKQIVMINWLLFKTDKIGLLTSFWVKSKILKVKIA